MKFLLLIHFLSFFVFLVIAQKDQNETSIGSLCTKAKTEVKAEPKIAVKTEPKVEAKTEAPKKEEATGNEK